MISGFVPIAPILYRMSNRDPKYMLESLAGVSTPSLVVWGGNDTAGREVSIFLLGVLRESQPLEIPNAAHACYVQNPKLFVTKLIEFALSLQNFE